VCRHDAFAFVFSWLAWTLAKVAPVWPGQPKVPFEFIVLDPTVLPPDVSFDAVVAECKMRTVTMVVPVSRAAWVRSMTYLAIQCGVWTLGGSVTFVALPPRKIFSRMR
jgi:hypothetical protein